MYMLKRIRVVVRQTVIVSQEPAPSGVSRAIQPLGESKGQFSDCSGSAHTKMSHLGVSYLYLLCVINWLFSMQDPL